MDPFTSALASAGVSAVGSIGGGMLAQNPKETKIQKQKRKLVDDLIASLKGGGSFSDLFDMDEDAFQKSYVDPAKSRFKNQIAPQIQQSYIAGGQQRGTALDDTLTRAGVDMDQLINEQYMNFQKSGMDRKANAINSILGGGDGVQEGMSGGEKFASSASGYLNSDAFGGRIDKILEGYNKRAGYASSITRP